MSDIPRNSEQVLRDFTSSMTSAPSNRGDASVTPEAYTLKVALKDVSQNLQNLIDGRFPQGENIAVDLVAKLVPRDDVGRFYTLHAQEGSAIVQILSPSPDVPLDSYVRLSLQVVGAVQVLGAEDVVDMHGQDQYLRALSARYDLSQDLYKAAPQTIEVLNAADPLHKIPVSLTSQLLQLQGGDVHAPLLLGFDAGQGGFIQVQSVGQFGAGVSGMLQDGGRGFLQHLLQQSGRVEFVAAPLQGDVRSILQLPSLGALVAGFGGEGLGEGAEGRFLVAAVNQSNLQQFAGASSWGASDAAPNLDVLMQHNSVRFADMVHIVAPFGDAVMLPSVQSEALLLQAMPWASLNGLMRGQDGANQLASSLTPMRAAPQNVQTMMPALLFFMSALKAGDVKSWFNEAGLEALSRGGKKGALQSFLQEAGALSRATQSSGDEWRSFALPMHYEGEFQKIILHSRTSSGDEGGGKGSGGVGKRFVFDLHLRHMGDIQLDGYFRGKNLDLVLRSEHSFSAQARHKMRHIYHRAIEGAGLTGQISFQGGQEGWLRVQKLSAARLTQDI